MFLSLLSSSDSKTKLTFYGGIHEIGGNKFLIEDRGTRIFLDFGMQIGRLIGHWQSNNFDNKMV